jgi:acetylornithine deacetylase/succinyl-diaminopimelate desuccinylase-like protein
MSSMEAALQVAKEREGANVEDLQAFLRMPSVAAQNLGMLECAEFLAAHFRAIGCDDARVVPTAGFPVVCAEVRGESERSVLVYGHYDVQPPEPLDAWPHPPWSAHLENGRIYARGAVDDKGNFYCAVKAVEAYLKAGRRPPVTVKFWIEGEEEVGSPNLGPFAREHYDWLKCDGMILQDGGVASDGRTEFNLGMKGMLYLELSVRKNPRDLHSGKAPVVENAAWRLIWALSSLKGPDDRVLVEGFYDNIQPVTEAEMACIRQNDIPDQVLIDEFGGAPLKKGLTGPELFKTLYFEPTMTVCGIDSGYTGPGQKTVLPASAKAKMDIRLVPGQDPRDILAKVKQHLVSHGFDDIEVKTLGGEGLPAGRTSVEAPVAQALLKAVTDEWNGRTPIIKPSVEGSGPGSVFSDILQIPWALTRFGPKEALMHAPGEYTEVAGYLRGIRTIIKFLDYFRDWA